MSNAICLYQKFYQIAEVVHVIQPEYVVTCVFQFALTRYIVKTVTQKENELIQLVFSTKPASWMLSRSWNSASYIWQTDFTASSNSSIARFVSSEKIYQSCCADHFWRIFFLFRRDEQQKSCNVHQQTLLRVWLQQRHKYRNPHVWNGDVNRATIVRPKRAFHNNRALLFHMWRNQRFWMGPALQNLSFSLQLYNSSRRRLRLQNFQHGRNETRQQPKHHWRLQALKSVHDQLLPVYVLCKQRTTRQCAFNVLQTQEGHMLQVFIDVCFCLPYVSCHVFLSLRGLVASARSLACDLRAKAFLFFEDTLNIFCMRSKMR